MNRICWTCVRALFAEAAARKEMNKKSSEKYFNDDVKRRLGCTKNHITPLRMARKKNAVHLIRMAAVMNSLDLAETYTQPKPKITVIGRHFLRDFYILDVSFHSPCFSSPLSLSVFRCSSPFLLLPVIPHGRLCYSEEFNVRHAYSPTLSNSASYVYQPDGDLWEHFWVVEPIGLGREKDRLTHLNISSNQ